VESALGIDFDNPDLDWKRLSGLKPAHVVESAEPLPAHELTV
jgi:hypothetical protein